MIPRTSPTGGPSATGERRPRVAVIGASGQLGGDLVEAFGCTGRWEVAGLDHRAVEVRDAASVEGALTRLRPAVVINSAAFNRVDACESEVEATFQVNAFGALHVARAAARLGALAVYISTDYVFDGEKGAPYGEVDTPRPINVYGASKLAGEVLVGQAAERWLIVRVASLFGRRGARTKGGNFVTTVLRKAGSGEALRVVDDVVMSPTYTRDAAVAIERLVAAGVTGVVHVTNGGRCSWYEFARAVLQAAGLSAPLQPIASAQYPTAARRPRFSALDTTLATTHIGPGVLRPWQDALQEYVGQLTRTDYPAGH